MFHSFFENVRPTTISCGSNSERVSGLETDERQVNWRIVTSFMIHQFFVTNSLVSSYGRRG